VLRLCVAACVAVSAAVCVAVCVVVCVAALQLYCTACVRVKYVRRLVYIDDTKMSPSICVAVAVCVAVQCMLQRVLQCVLRGVLQCVAVSREDEPVSSCVRASYLAFCCMFLCVSMCL